MKSSVRFGYSLICLLQAAGLLFNNCGAVLAAASPLEVQSLSQTDGSRLDGFERTVFGVAHTSKSDEARVRELEVSLFGKSKSGPASERLAAISKALSSSSGNLLMPAIAPQMDNSATYSGPVPQPASALNDSNDARQDQSRDELRRAMSYYSQGNTAQAEQSFHKVLTLDSHNSDAYYNLGVIEEARGNLADALRDYKTALSISPNDGDLQKAVASVQTKIDQRVADARRANEAQSTAARESEQQRARQSLQQYTADASAAFKSGNFDRAIGDLQAVAHQAPTDPDVQYALAQAYRGKGDLFDARSSLTRAMTLEPSNQLYKTALSQVEQEIAHGGANRGSAGGDGMPAPAPDFRTAAKPGQTGGFASADGTGNNYGSSATPGQVVGFSQDASNSSAPVGQLTPFSDSGMRQLNPQRGYAFSSGGYGGMGSGYGYASTNNRVAKTAVYGLSGAAMGAVMSSMFAPPGYRGRSMMRGAMLGGAMGLITGGLFSH